MDNKRVKRPKERYNKDMELKQGQTTGVIIRPIGIKSWVSGKETGVVRKDLGEGGQYDAYLPDEEAQSTQSFDTLSCVTFSALNVVETLINRMRAKGTLSKKAEEFLVNEGYINPLTNKVNFSDRYIAKQSGTTTDGNDLESVGNAIRKGLVPEKDWPMPWNEAFEKMTFEEGWKEYMKEIPQSVKDKAERFKKYFKITHQWEAIGTSTPEQLQNALKYGPLQIATLVCYPWNSTESMPPIPACGYGSGHATIIYGYREDGAWKDFDHYRSYRKLLAKDYGIPWAVQYFVEEQEEVEQTNIVTIPFMRQLRYKMGESFEVTNLQRALQTLKDKNGNPYMKPGVFGPYGPQTRDAVGRFQTEHGITDPDGQGMNFGPKTMKSMDEALQVLKK